jgi:hypothetical protein
MTNLVNTTGINTVKVLADYTEGKFRVITKCRAGWMTIIDCREYDNKYYMTYPESIITGYKKGALQTVEFQPEGYDYYFTVFTRKGNKIVLIDETILANLTVGTINQLWSNTNLYNQSQYTAVNAKTWADLAYVRKDATVTDSNREPVILENL